MYSSWKDVIAIQNYHYFILAKPNLRLGSPTFQHRIRYFIIHVKYVKHTHCVHFKPKIHARLVLSFKNIYVRMKVLAKK